MMAGIAIAVIGAGWMYQEHVILWPDHPARGTVTQVMVSSAPRGHSSLFRVDVTYIYGGAGKSYTGQFATLFTRHPSLSVGQEVTLLYTPQHPEAPRFAPFTALWITQDTTLSTIVFSIGSIAAILGVLADLPRIGAV
jgi:hypothetical protein